VRLVRLAAAGWRSGPLALAETRVERLLGIRGLDPGVGLLLRTRSVHSIGLALPLLIMAVDLSGRVVCGKMLAPHRVVFVAEAAWIAELPSDAFCPEVGTRLVVERLLG